MLLFQVPPRFLKKPQDKTEFSTKDIELECGVYGIPEPKIHWFKNGELVKYSEYYKLVNVYVVTLCFCFYVLLFYFTFILIFTVELFLVIT